MTKLRPLPLLLAFLFLATPGVRAAARNLERGFQHPPADARPWVYWFWLNGNISSNGITADLEAMKRVGIGGVLIMEVDQGAPVGPVDFMSNPWRNLFRHVHQEARRLGLEVNMNDDAGWNGSGGPWIRPEQSMRKIVWSETNVVGPVHFEGTLPQPETVAGSYRDLTIAAFPAVSTNRLDGIRAKAMYEVGGVGGIARGTVPPEAVIKTGSTTLLPNNETTPGKVSWEVPAGTWTLMRFGHTSTGAENAPAPRTGRGLECDKLSREGIEAQFAAMMARLATDNGLRPGPRKPGLVATHIDSWENGSQNWTDRMREEFRQRRGYDLLPFLPVYSGRIVGSVEISERFLWDLRQTVSELVIENYAGRMRDLAHANGLRFTVEAYGGPCDSIAYAGRSDEPMGEFWTPSGALETCKAMASAGHVYGKRIVGAEAFTSGDQERWREHPALLKAHGDRAFCEGINRFVFHRYALQPWTAPDRLPGMTMGPWGQHYERSQTWWEWTPAWHDYLARCQFLLRQGLFVADVCHVVPELPPQGPGDHRREGYDWDECPAEVVVERMSVRDGRLILPDGMSYRLLVLPDSVSMTPRLLARLSELVQSGATILGPKPTFSPSIQNYPACDAEVRRRADELWGDCDGNRVKQRAFGRGRVCWGLTPAQVLKLDQVPNDFAASQPLRYLHRTGSDFDLYFVANLQPHAFTTPCSFRVTGRIPELWWPDSGRLERAAVYQEKDGLTHVVIPFESSGSVFVVFREQRGHDDPVVSLTHNGKPALTAAPEPLPHLKITRARYGALNDPARSREATAEVQTHADAGDFSFVVSTLAAAGDPAPQAVKELVVDYEFDGRQLTVKARDPDKIRLGPEALRATVETARYGILEDPQRTRDVRDRVQRIIDAGEISFTVARMAAGDDPAFLVVKTLELELTVDGRRVHLSGRDPDLIQLRPPAAPPTAVASVHRSATGRILVTPREPGEYRWTTAAGKSGRIQVPSLAAPQEVPGPWNVRFAALPGAASERSFDPLRSWSESTDPEVKYYSGTATYSRTLTVPGKSLARGSRLLLDLGRVEVMARVKLNGRVVATMWKPPFIADLTGGARAGENALEIEVVNLWPNRLIGDEQLPEDSERNPDGTLKRWPAWVGERQPSPTGRTTFTSWRLWRKTDALLPSGLLGPVTLRTEFARPAR